MLRVSVVWVIELAVFHLTHGQVLAPSSPRPLALRSGNSTRTSPRVAQCRSPCRSHDRRPRGSLCPTHAAHWHCVRAVCAAAPAPPQPAATMPRILLQAASAASASRRGQRRQDQSGACRQVGEFWFPLCWARLGAFGLLVAGSRCLSIGHASSSDTAVTDEAASTDEGARLIRGAPLFRRWLAAGVAHGARATCACECCVAQSTRRTRFSRGSTSGSGRRCGSPRRSASG